METKNAAFEVKEVAEDGTFEGYASVFGNVDRGMDVVMPGCFAKSLKGRKPKMLWQHDTREVIGRWDSVSEDNKGLYVKGRLFADLPRGKEALTLLREGEIDSMSIGYVTREASEEGRARKLIEVDLYEVSLVTFPMNEAAKVVSVKAEATHDIREFEGALRDVFALSQAEAKAFLAKGFRGLQDQREAGSGEADSEGFNALLSQLTNLKEAFNA